MLNIYATKGRKDEEKEETCPKSILVGVIPPFLFSVSNSFN
jgi:hypothetical protein